MFTGWPNVGAWQTRRERNRICPASDPQEGHLNQMSHIRARMSYILDKVTWMVIIEAYSSTRS